MALGELLMRTAVRPQWLYPMNPPEDALLVEHPVRGYALQSGLSRRWARADFDVSVDLNERGQRDSAFADARRAPIRLLAVGDSYTFGIGVEASATWPERIEQALGLEATSRAVAVVNAGVPGYSALQIRQVIEEIVPELEPDAVIFAMYASSYWRVRNPYAIHGGTLITASRRRAVGLTSDGTPVTTPFLEGRVRTLDLWLKGHFHIGARLLSLWNGGRHWPSGPPHPETDLRADYEPALAEIRRTHAWLKERGIPLLLLAVNGQREDGDFPAIESEYNEILRKFAARGGIPFVDPLPRLRATAEGRPIFRYPQDIHWTAAAHSIAAEMVLAELRRLGHIPASREVT